LEGSSAGINLEAMRNAMENLHHIIDSTKDYNLHTGSAGINVKIRWLLQIKMYENKPQKFLNMIANFPVPWLRFKLSTSKIKVEHYHFAITFWKMMNMYSITFDIVCREEIPLLHEAVLGSPDLTEADDGEDMYIPAHLLHTERPRVLAEVELDQLPSYK
jgi:hypothetical protein